MPHARLRLKGRNDALPPGYHTLVAETFLAVGPSAGGPALSLVMHISSAQTLPAPQFVSFFPSSCWRQHVLSAAATPPNSARQREQMPPGATACRLRPLLCCWLPSAGHLTHLQTEISHLAHLQNDIWRVKRRMSPSDWRQAAARRTGDWRSSWLLSVRQPCGRASPNQALSITSATVARSAACGSCRKIRTQKDEGSRTFINSASVFWISAASPSCINTLQLMLGLKAKCTQMPLLHARTQHPCSRGSVFDE